MSNYCGIYFYGTIIYLYILKIVETLSFCRFLPMPCPCWKTLQHCKSWQLFSRTRAVAHSFWACIQIPEIFHWIILLFFVLNLIYYIFRITVRKRCSALMVSISTQKHLGPVTLVATPWTYLVVAEQLFVSLFWKVIGKLLVWNWSSEFLPDPE